jgi:hypothetical protein
MASRARRHAAIENFSFLGIHARMGPLMLHQYAELYCQAAESVQETEHRLNPARGFLICHSLELSLKAILSLHGMTLFELSDVTFGHNLDRLLECVDQNSHAAVVQLTAANRAAIGQASEYYAAKVFEYPALEEAVRGFPEKPDLGHLLEVARSLVDSLRSACSRT